MSTQIIKEENPNALHIHCNLAIIDIVKNIKTMMNAHNNMNEITKLEKIWLEPSYVTHHLVSDNKITLTFFA